MLDQYTINLQTGCLQLSVLSSSHKLENLLEFGSRLNPKRRFLFVSKILGKYIPCLPSSMRSSYQTLAEKIISTIGSNHDTWVLGVAETATGLAAGVAQELVKSSTKKSSLIYSHTTRNELDHEIDFSILEAHSHAPSHLIYQLDTSLDNRHVSSVVLIDDEISTGNTLARMTENLLARLPNLTHVTWVSLVNWMSEDERLTIKEKYPNITLHFVSLLDGTFEFTVNDNFTDLLPPKTATGISGLTSRYDTGRTGYLMHESPRVEFSDSAGVFNYRQLNIEQQYVVLGTGEFSYQPFLFAEQLQKEGFDVLFQSTGRSPAIEDHGICSKIGCFDEGHQGMYYLYNLPTNRDVIICYENQEQLDCCPFREMLKAKTLVLNHFSSHST